MITLEKFKEILNTIKKFDEDNQKLSEILIKETYGFIDFYYPITKIVNDLLLDIFDCDDLDIFDWWMYENVEKIITMPDKTKYDLTSIEDFYNYLTYQFDKVKKI